MADLTSIFKSKEGKTVMGLMLLTATAFTIYNHYTNIQLNKLRMEKLEEELEH